MKKQLIFLSTYPPRECGIATFTQDLINAMRERVERPVEMKVCALEDGISEFSYDETVLYRMDTTDKTEYLKTAHKINNNPEIVAVMVEHEFGLYGGKYGDYLLDFLKNIEKPVAITFHTVLPIPDDSMKKVIMEICQYAFQVIVMTNNSAKLMNEVYTIPKEKVKVISHGTHLNSWKNSLEAKKQFGLEDRLILSTFGLMGPNKSIETALDALPEIVKEFPSVIYLILGQTHPGVLKNEGERYRHFLEERVESLNIQDNVLFVNKYLNLNTLLDYLWATDIYLFTSKDINQAVSGTFAYALSCACPVIATSIPHAREVLTKDIGNLIDFEKPVQLAHGVLHLLRNWSLRNAMSVQALIKSRASVWENTSVQTFHIFEKMIPRLHLHYKIPPVNISYLNRMTTDIGIVQYSKVDNPDLFSGYRLYDNALALIAVVDHYIQTKEPADISLLETYLSFFKRCQRSNGMFINYLDNDGMMHIRNNLENLEESNGLAIWALGYFLSKKEYLNDTLVARASGMFKMVWKNHAEFRSPRAMAFMLKGLYFYYLGNPDKKTEKIINKIAKSLLHYYNDISDKNWHWFEEYFIYSNASLPESMLYAWKVTGNITYRIVATSTFDFLLEHLFKNGKLMVISNGFWDKNNNEKDSIEQKPIDVLELIRKLNLFYQEIKDDKYKNYLQIAFSWFLGNNNIEQMVYNPATGGCYDGFTNKGLNLNQSAESTLAYLISRLTINDYIPFFPISPKKIKGNTISTFEKNIK